MFLDGAPIRFPWTLAIVHAVFTSLVFNAYLALRVAQDARKRNIPLRMRRLFAGITLLLSFLAIAAYMAYEIARRSRMPPGTAEQSERPRAWTLIIEILLAAFIIGLFYFFVRRVILMDFFEL